MSALRVPGSEVRVQLRGRDCLTLLPGIPLVGIKKMDPSERRV